MVQHHRIPVRPPSIDELVVSDGEPMETARHAQQMTILVESLRYAWRDRSDFYVGGNMFFYFSETQAKKNDFRGPDVFVVLDTTQRDRRAWVVWEENGQVPNVVIELLSETTAKVDQGEKMHTYERLRVGEYFLFDPFTAALEGYELESGEYRRKQADAEGRLGCDCLGLRLGTVSSNLYGVEAQWLRWIGRDGEPLLMPTDAAISANVRAAAERRRADEEHERAERERERADLERERADTERARADAESRSAAGERERARAALARVHAEAERADAERERADRLAAELDALKRR